MIARTNLKPTRQRTDNKWKSAISTYPSNRIGILCRVPEVKVVEISAILLPAQNSFRGRKNGSRQLEPRHFRSGVFPKGLIALKGNSENVKTESYGH
jgi:hypothetical protein